MHYYMTKYTKLTPNYFKLRNSINEKLKYKNVNIIVKIPTFIINVILN